MLSQRSNSRFERPQQLGRISDEPVKVGLARRVLAMRECQRALAIFCLVAPVFDNAKGEGVTAETVQKNLVQKTLDESVAASFA